MSRTFLYDLAKAPVRLALGVYFRGLEVIGEENVPSQGPVLLAANHPQSITDALVLSAGVDRVVHYLAHGGLFKNRVLAFLLRHCGVIPIYRPSDDPNQAQAANRGAFDACTDLLREGGAIGIFPEGISVEERKVQRLRTGAARIALESEERHGFGLGVQIVPVGLSFESRARFRSRVLMRIGQPIAAGDYREEYDTDPRQAVTRLTVDLSRAIRSRVVSIEHGELAELIEQVERTYRDELLDNPDLVIEGTTNFQKEQVLSQEIAQAVHHFHDTDPEAVWSVQQRLHAYRRRLERMKISDKMIRDGDSPTIRRRALRLAVWGLLGLPLGLYGLVINFAPYWVLRRVVRRIDPDGTKRHYHQLVVGSILFLLYYPALVWLVWQRWQPDPWPLAFFAASLLPAGLFARFYVRQLIRERRMIRFAYINATHRAAIAQLHRLRREVIAEMNVLLRRYLKVRRPTTPEATS